MEKNTEKMVEAMAPIKEFKPISTALCGYMNPTTLEYFIAELYSNEILYFKENDRQMTESMGVLIDAISHLNCNSGIEDSLDNIMNILKVEYSVETTEIDKLVMIFIADEDEYQPLDYYRSKALDYVAISKRLSNTAE